MHHNSQSKERAALGCELIAPCSLGCELHSPCREAPPSVLVDGFLQVAPQIVTWEGISCKVTQGHSGQQRQILHSISGVAAIRGEDGDLVPCLFAVLGPSGAGKTTFMDILSGRKRDSGQFTSGCTCNTLVQILPCSNLNLCAYLSSSLFMPQSVIYPQGLISCCACLHFYQLYNYTPTLSTTLTSPVITTATAAVAALTLF